MTSGRRGFAVLVVVVGAVLAAAGWGCGGSPEPGTSTPPTTPSPTPTTPTPAPAPLKRLLVVTHTAGFRHSSIAIAETTIRDIGVRNSLFETEFCRSESDVKSRLTTEGLRGFDGVFFANTTGNLGIPDVPAFLDWVRAGHGFLGAHSASDTYHDSIDFLTMLGGEFNTHGAIVPGDIRVDDASDQSVAHLAPRFTITDELYRFDRNSRANVHALLSMDRVPNDGVGTAGAPADLLMAWRREYGSGRVFYTAFGHREEVWQDPRFQQHLLGALRWALGS
jgi:type 1 glutamine amidotransferase